MEIQGIKKLGSSPLTRGKHCEIGGRDASARLIPTHAGKTVIRRRIRRRVRAHPHSRGENSKLQAALNREAGSSPLTRGKPADRIARMEDTRLIPTHAGKTAVTAGRTSVPTAHPHSRGENMYLPWPVTVPAGSSPLTRGKHRSVGGDAGRWGLIPTHAGKTHARRRLPRRNRAHPHSRGENVTNRSKSGYKTGSSPLTRGKHGERCLTDA